MEQSPGEANVCSDSQNIRRYGLLAKDISLCLTNQVPGMKQFYIKINSFFW